MKTILLSILLAGLLAGCGSWSPIHPYRMDIQQGNLVTQDMLDKLKPGMTPSQVRYALGTPLIVDPFHTERWDYVYVMRKEGKVTERRRITVIFENDRFKGLEGDVKPGADKAAPPAGAAPVEVQPLAPMPAPDAAGAPQ